jgi:hypothetical protein
VFFSFISYLIALLLCFPNLDIKSLKDSHIVHFEKLALVFTHLHLDGVSSSTYNVEFLAYLQQCKQNNK